jgi:hypothetical protein
MTLEQANPDNLSKERLPVSPILVQKLHPNPVIKKKEIKIKKVDSPVSTKYAIKAKENRVSMVPMLIPTAPANGSFANSLYSNKTQRRGSQKDINSSPDRRVNRDLRAENEFSDSTFEN